MQSNRHHEDELDEDWVSLSLVAAPSVIDFSNASDGWLGRLAVIAPGHSVHDLIIYITVICRRVTKAVSSCLAVLRQRAVLPSWSF
jgi:hypothetical protein